MNEQGTIRDKVVKGVFWLSLTRGLGQVATWAITIFVVRLLSPGDYGLMGMAGLLTGFLMLFSELGLGAAIVQKPDLDADDISNISWVILGFNLFLCVALVALAPAVAQYFHEPRLVAVVRVVSLGFVMNGFGSSSAYMLQRTMDFRKKASAEFAGNLAGSLSTLALAAAGLGVWSLVVGYLLQRLATNVLYFAYCPVRLRRRLSRGNLGKHMNFGSQLAAAKILWYASSNADVAIVGRVLGPTLLGFYSLAFQFASMPIEKIVSILQQVALPSFATVQHDAETLGRHYLKLVSLVAFVTFPMFMGMFLVADGAVELLLTRTWLPVIVPLKLLCIVSCFRAIETMNAPVVVAKGRPDVVLWNNLLQAVVLPVSFYVGTRWGLDGVAWAWVATRPVLFAVITLNALQVVELPVTRYVAALKHPIAGTAAMMAAVVTAQRYAFVELRPGAGLAAASALGAVVYGAYMVSFNRPLLQELSAIGRFRRIVRSPGLSSATSPVAVPSTPEQ